MAPAAQGAGVEPQGEHAAQPAGLSSIEEVEVLLRICSHLPPTDLARLACVSRAFGGEIEWRSAADGDGDGTPALRSVVEEAACRWVLARPQAAAAAAVRGEGQSWVRYAQHIQGWPVRFAAAHKSISLSEDGAVATVLAAHSRYAPASYRTAAAGSVLRPGRRHRCVFTVLKRGHCGTLFVGVVAEGFDVRDAEGAQHADGHCFVRATDGQCFPSDSRARSRWVGGFGEGDRVELALDSIGGSMTVFNQSGTQRGVVQESGLTGNYRWAVCLPQHGGDSIRIEPAPAAAAMW